MYNDIAPQQFREEDSKTEAFPQKTRFRQNNIF